MNKECCKKFQKTALLAAIALTAAFVLISCSSGESGQNLSGGAPDFLLPAVDGSMVRLSDHSGKVIIVDFWATTRSPVPLVECQLSPPFSS